MDMRINPPCRNNRPFTRQSLRSRADHHRIKLPRRRIRNQRPNPILNPRIPRMADTHNPTSPNPDIRLNNAQLRINDRRIRDHQIERFRIQRRRRLPHSITNHLPSAKLHLIPIPSGLRNQIPLNLNE